MSPGLDLDFLAPPGRPAAWSWLVLALGLAVAAWSAQSWQAAREARAQAQARLDESGRVTRPPAARPVRPDPRDQARRQAEAAARAHLAGPWDDLLQTLQASRPKEVALLSLEGDGRRRDFRLEAEARGHAVMLDWLRRLQRDEALADVVLTEHQGVESDGARVIRFALAGRWGRP